MKVTVVAGNPKPGSRTLDAATVLATALTGEAPDHVSTSSPSVRPARWATTR